MSDPGVCAFESVLVGVSLYLTWLVGAGRPWIGGIELPMVLRARFIDREQAYLELGAKGWHSLDVRHGGGWRGESVARDVRLNQVEGVMQMW